MPKCTRRHTVPRRIAFVALSALLSGTAAAQALAIDAELLAAPGQRPLATLKKGAAIRLGATEGQYVHATVEGWLAAPLLAAGSDSFPVTVRPGTGARLRAAPSAQSALVAQLRAGIGLVELRRQGAWVAVARSGWVRSSLVDTQRPVTVAASGTTDTTTPRAASAPERTDSSRNGIELTPTAQTTLTSHPDGPRVGTLAPGARAVVTGRERGWIRVQVEAWAREADFTVADTAMRGALTAADLRADPEGTIGRLVHWEVQILAHQVSDPLRKGLAINEPYLLAQGPGREQSLLYLAIPASLAVVARDIPDLAKVTITARVRTGKSEPVGVPILELISIVRR